MTRVAAQYFALRTGANAWVRVTGTAQGNVIVQSFRALDCATGSGCLQTLGMSDPNPDEQAKRVREELFAGNKIQAVKFYRGQTGVGLKEAKDAVEKLEAELRASSPIMFAQARGVRRLRADGALGLGRGAVAMRALAGGQRRDGASLCRGTQPSLPFGKKARSARTRSASRASLRHWTGRELLPGVSAPR